MIAQDETRDAAIGPVPLLLGRLLKHGCEFDFFQAVWLLERLTNGATVVGGRGPVAQESLRFRPDVSMGFPSTDVKSIRVEPDADTGAPRYDIDVTFLGLYGASTPLPLHYGVDILRSVDAAQAPGAAAAASAPTTAPDTAGHSPTRDFLDVFHHRLISLFYRCWTKYRFDVSYGITGRSASTDYMLWLLGLFPGCDESLIGVEPIRLLRYAGIFTQHPRSAATLEGVLSDYWDGLPFRVRQFRGRWVALQPTDMNHLGQANCGLGTDMTVGEQVFDLAGALTVALGPVDWATYAEFLPDGSRFKQTRCLVQLYCPDPLAFTIEITLQAGCVPETRLTSDSAAGRLGYTSWVRTQDVGETTVLFEATPTAPPAIFSLCGQAAQPDRRAAAAPAGRPGAERVYWAANPQVG